MKYAEVPTFYTFYAFIQCQVLTDATEITIVRVTIIFSVSLYFIDITTLQGKITSFGMQLLSGYVAYACGHEISTTNHLE